MYLIIKQQCIDRCGQCTAVLCGKYIFYYLEEDKLYDDIDRQEEDEGVLGHVAEE